MNKRTVTNEHNFLSCPPPFQIHLDSWILINRKQRNYRLPRAFSVKEMANLQTNMHDIKNIFFGPFKRKKGYFCKIFSSNNVFEFDTSSLKFNWWFFRENIEFGDITKILRFCLIQAYTIWSSNYISNLTHSLNEHFSVRVLIF